MAYWLFKTEPDELSIDDLAAEPERSFLWDGVRNYQARNFLRDLVQLGDQVFIYHSSCKPPGIAGIASISRAAYPDPSQFKPDSPYFDAKSNPQTPRWVAVDVKFEQKFAQFLTLDKLKKIGTLDQMPLVRKGNRLSVMPVTEQEWRTILSLTALSNQD
ncbi:EVE domain-containing protein [Alkalimonas sp. MEB108]|uniref:EVE domain-containing protein n=1 Tax=Alkalimonas cellulosilytica TaxID=3058395 RepID=A0ABU7J6Q5_9GAMM|nr:EVE domain-containing protein [Alkalimonas sp. MEB108]MEE2002204.1 EVE domain-containing protein [Alkalimonas sp. MEB108]